MRGSGPGAATCRSRPSSRDLGSSPKGPKTPIPATIAAVTSGPRPASLILFGPALTAGRSVGHRASGLALRPIWLSGGVEVAQAPQHRRLGVLHGFELTRAEVPEAAFVGRLELGRDAGEREGLRVEPGMFQR